MKTLTVRTLLVSLTLGIAIVSGTSPAGAQMVPRLVSYARPATVAEPCETAAAGRSLRRSVEYRASDWTETVTIYNGATCDSQSALYTVRSGGAYDWAERAAGVVAYRTITPTGAGVAYLAQACSAYAWSAGVPQALPASACTP